jgi:hypothetical protein
MKCFPMLAAIALAVPVSAEIEGEPRAGSAAISAPKKNSARLSVFTRLFNEANTDGNDYLDAAEFALSYGASPRPVVTEYRFQALSTLIAIDSKSETTVRGILIEDFIEANGGRKLNPSKADIFLLADDNADGYIDWFEYPVTRIQKTAVRGSIFDSFDKLDRDDDALITPAEWGIEVED